MFCKDTPRLLLLQVRVISEPILSSCHPSKSVKLFWLALRCRTRVPSLLYWRHLGFALVCSIVAAHCARCSLVAEKAAKSFGCHLSAGAPDIVQALSMELNTVPISSVCLVVLKREKPGASKCKARRAVGRK